MAIIQGEGLEPSEMPLKKWTGGNHPGRLRFQSFRPQHDEPLTDVLIGQGMMSLGGGGYGGGGLPYPSEVLQLWGGEILQAAISTPAAPTVVKDDGSGAHQYAIIAVGVQVVVRPYVKHSRKPKGWPGSDGTATLAPIPTSLSATVEKSRVLCGSKEHKRNGRITVANDRLN